MFCMHVCVIEQIVLSENNTIVVKSNCKLFRVMKKYVNWGKDTYK